MKIKPNQDRLVEDAIDTVKALESDTGVKVKTGLRAGGGAGGGKGGVVTPLYGNPPPAT
ncbi:MAG: hypothetical protein ABMB14_16470 [Myxococcota bacterium]